MTTPTEEEIEVALTAYKAVAGGSGDDRHKDAMAAAILALRRLDQERGLVTMPRQLQDASWDALRSFPSVTHGDGGFDEFTGFDGDWGNWNALWYAMIAAALEQRSG